MDALYFKFIFGITSMIWFPWLVMFIIFIIAACLGKVPFSALLVWIRGIPNVFMVQIAAMLAMMYIGALIVGLNYIGKLI